MIPYHDKELVKLEEEQRILRERAEANIQDRINTITQPQSRHDYMRIVNADIQIAPKTGEKLKDYIQRIKIFQEIAYRKNWETHVDNGRKTWHTHTRPQCFMCEDQQFISVIVQSLQVINKQNPDLEF